MKASSDKDKFLEYSTHKEDTRTHLGVGYSHEQVLVLVLQYVLANAQVRLIESGARVQAAQFDVDAVALVLPRTLCVFAVVRA